MVMGWHGDADWPYCWNHAIKKDHETPTTTSIYDDGDDGDDDDDGDDGGDGNDGDNDDHGNDDCLAGRL